LNGELRGADPEVSTCRRDRGCLALGVLVECEHAPNLRRENDHVQTISITDIADNFADVVALVSTAKQRVLVEENGVCRAAFISLEDMEVLETLDGDREVPTEHVTVRDVQQHLRDDVNEVFLRDERIVLRDDREDVAVLVPRRDVSVLENLDGRLDLEAAKRLLDDQIGEERSA